MRTFLAVFFLAVTFQTVQAQQFYADDLLKMLSLTSEKAEVTVQKKGYLFSAEETKGDTAYKTFIVRIPYKKRKKEFTDRNISIGQVKEEPVIIYNTTKADDFLKIKVALEKKHYSVSGLFTGCPPLFFIFRNKEYTITSQTFKQDTLTWYSLCFHKKKLPAKQDIHYAEDLLQFDSHEYLTAVFGTEHLKSDLYYFSDEEVSKCSVLFPNTPMQVVFIWEDELNFRKLSSVIIGGRDEMRKPSDPKTEIIVSENKWRFHHNIYLGMSLQQMRTIHGENFDFFGANSKYTGLIRPNKTGTISFNKHHFLLGCLNCKESQEFRKKEIISADEAARKGLILFLSSVVLIPEKETE